MKKTIFALLGTALLAGIYSFIPHTAKKEVATYSVSAEKSRIDWVAAKKTAYHTGFFPLKSGEVQLDDNKLKGGKSVIDLANLKVTDAGGGDRLTGHLKTPDFFDVAKFGEATYEITGVNYTSDNTADINGTLTLKGASFPIKLTANIRGVDEKNFFAQAFFSLDRTTIGINFNGPAKDVQLAVHLFASK